MQYDDMIYTAITRLTTITVHRANHSLSCANQEPSGSIDIIRPAGNRILIDGDDNRGPHNDHRK